MQRNAILFFAWLIAAVTCLVVRADPPGEHPLKPLLKLARLGHARITKDVQDYTCVLVKRERINGELTGPEMIFAKVRHERTSPDQRKTPFSVYMKFLEPRHVEGREILFAMENDDSKLLVRNGGVRLAFLTLSLLPQSRLAMNGNRYPITEFGIKRLTERMIELGTKELAHQECEVTIENDIQVDQYRCTCIEIKHPLKREWFQYHIARIFIDDAMGVPVRFESYDWPTIDDGKPVLQEEYTYRDLKLNVGLSDEDFEPDYPDYRFR